MNDPHVVSISYSLKISENIELPDNLEMEIERPKFIAKLDTKGLIIFFKEHYATKEEAIQVANIFIKGWEISIGLQYQPDIVLFKYESCEIVDRNPDPNFVSIRLEGIASVTVFGNMTVHSKWVNFPVPPDDFVVSPDVETMWFHNKMYTENKETLEPMAYFCLTMLEDQFANPTKPRKKSSKRIKAADYYKIDYEVLDTLGELTSAKGNRKAYTRAQLTPIEKRWIEVTVKAIIKQCGIVEAEIEPHSLKMSDLPSLAVKDSGTK